MHIKKKDFQTLWFVIFMVEGEMRDIKEGKKKIKCKDGMPQMDTLSMIPEALAILEPYRTKPICNASKEPL